MCSSDLVLPLHQVNGVGVDRPHVDTAVGPVSEHDIQTAAGCTQVISRTQLSTRALKRLLDQLGQVEVKTGGSRGVGHYLNLAVFFAIALGWATNCFPAFLPARFARVDAAYSAGLRLLIAASGRYLSQIGRAHV